jgi:hypothetical protein
MPVIPATRESEMGRIKIQGQHRQPVCKTPISKIFSKMDWRCGSNSKVPALQA